MKKYFLGFLTMVVAFAATAQVTGPAKDLQDPVELLKRLDNPTQKGYLGSKLRASQTFVGLYTQSDSAYSNGVPGTYNLQDAVSGEKLVIPAGSVIHDVKIYTVTDLTGAGATVSVGYSGGAADLVAARQGDSFDAGVLAGVPVDTAATAVKRTADTDVTLTISGATVTAGKAYFLIRASTGLE